MSQHPLEEGGPPRPAEGAVTQRSLQRALSRAAWAIAWERLWPPLAALAMVVGVFVALSWAGVWLRVPPLGRSIGLCVLLLLAATAGVPLARFRWPSLKDRLNRLDRGSGLAHRPATAVADVIATSSSDQVSVALWQAHVERARQAARGLKVGWPRPALAARDPFALRALVLLLVVTTFYAAGGDRLKRVAAAFDWAGVVTAANFRVDAWLTPPPYTGRPPLILPGLRAGEPVQAVAPMMVPAGSVLTVRATGASGLDVSATDGLAPASNDPKSPPPSGTEEHRFTLKDSASVTVRTRGGDVTWTFNAIPDRAPSIALTKDPQVQARGSLLLVYKLEDDYGVVSARARFARKAASGASSRPLYGPPDFSLLLPQTRVRSGIGQTTKDLTDHPWAGSEVVLTLTARDEAGNEGSSAPVELRLPERVFTKPLARALVEQRRILALDGDARPHVLAALDALSIAPERFTPQANIYLGLRAIRWQLDQAAGDNDLREVVARLWSMAVGLEDGDVSESEQALRAAQDALRQALERGANDQEIKRLTDELRAALDKFLQALAEQQRNNPQQLARPLDPNARVLRPQDLKNLLDRIENLARSGAKDAARQLLEELQSMLDNLQTAQPGPSPGDDDMMSALDDLGDMIRKQQQLRDRTFRQGQDARPGERPPQSSKNPRGDDSFEGLKQNQQALREQLKKLLDELRRRGELGQRGQQGQEGQQSQQGQQGQQGGSSEDDLGRAEQAMRDAENSLGEGNAEGAVDAQGKALDSLRKGAQSFAQQMQRQPGLGPGQAGRTGPPRASSDTDPLGRPMRGREYGDDVTVKVPGEIDVQRARRILEELRRRFADPQRPQLELDYLDRLLKGFQ
ncbi:MAG TPA: TIGR02302 family protein [Xanthobacteraceae bacterium]|nr:TIGR02302 family protein [Xanthobacteraceae bacterium]